MTQDRAVTPEPSGTVPGPVVGWERHRPARPPLVRPREGKVLGGVCVGLAQHLDLPVGLVRVLLVVGSAVGGFGAVVYVCLWALAPVGTGTAGGTGTAPSGTDSPRADGRRPAGAGPTGSGPVGQVGVATGSGPARSGSAGRGVPPVADPRWSGPAAGRGTPIPTDLAVGAVLLLAGLYALALRAGWAIRPQVVVPMIVVVVGAVIAYNQLDEVERGRWAERAGVGTRGTVLRVVGGVGLVVVGILLLVVGASDDVAQMGRTLVAALSVLGGVGLVLAPWAVRLWRDLDTERAARAREAERADIAAHLHDSVLQTLALIQRRSGEAAEVARLARAQERDLRGWLYGGPVAPADTLTAAVAAVAADVEDLHGAVVEVVTVGDRPVDERTGALLAALREALTNAARHGGGAVQVYLECGPDGVEAFVRDRGPGFDPQSVPADRLGVRESIVARMERHGGTARVVSAPGAGTEIRLAVPDVPDGRR